jgi:hypothetical protein
MTSFFSSFLNDVPPFFQEFPMTSPGILKESVTVNDLSFTRVSAGPVRGLNRGIQESSLPRACCLGPHPVAGVDLYQFKMQSA